jgi:hypothetical protein
MAVTLCSHSLTFLCYLIELKHNVMADQALPDPQVQAALGYIGFTDQAQAALNQHGFSSMNNMLIYLHDQIKCVCKVQCKDNNNLIHISMEHEKLFTPMWQWVKTRIQVN